MANVLKSIVGSLVGAWKKKRALDKEATAEMKRRYPGGASGHSASMMDEYNFIRKGLKKKSK